MAGPGFAFVAADPDDASAFGRYAAIRIAAMRGTLERLGLYDPAANIATFRTTYDPAWTREIRIHGGALLVGFVCLRPNRQPATAMKLRHFYLHPSEHGRGLGSAVMARLLAEADAAALPVRLAVLEGSRAVPFYQRFGFRPARREPPYLHLARPAAGPVPRTAR